MRLQKARSRERSKGSLPHELPSVRICSYARGFAASGAFINMHSRHPGWSDESLRWRPGGDRCRASGAVCGRCVQWCVEVCSTYARHRVQRRQTALAGIESVDFAYSPERQQFSFHMYLVGGPNAEQRLRWAAEILCFPQIL